MKFTFDVFAALAVAVLSGMGVGGGGLLVIYLTLIKDIKQLSAQGINLVFFVITAISAMVYHTRHRKLNYKIILICASAGIIGSILGHRIADYIGGNILRKIFGGFLIFCGTVALFSKKERNHDDKS